MADLTAEQAREAADWFRNAATYDHRTGAQPGREWYAMRGRFYDRAATALDAFAAGQHAASLEREAIRTAIEHMRDGGPNSDSEAYVYGAVLSIIDARGAK